MVAFIQNDQTREIYQVVSSPMDPITSVRPIYNNNPFGNVRTYPNPAIYSVTVEFASKLPGNCEMFLFNLNGKAVKTYRLFRDISLFNFDVSDLANGMYIMQIRMSNKLVTSRKLVVAH